MISKDSDLTYRSAKFQAGQNITKGDVLQLNNGQVYRINPGPIHYTPIDTYIVAVAGRGKPATATSDSTAVVAGCGADYDLRYRTAGIHDRHILAPTEYEVHAGTYSADNYIIASDTIDAGRTVIAAVNSNDLLTMAVTKKTNEKTSSYTTTLTGVYASEPSLMMFDNAYGIILAHNPNASYLEVKYFQVASNGTIAYNDPSGSGRSITSRTTFNNQLLWRGGDKFVATYSTTSATYCKTLTATYSGPVSDYTSELFINLVTITNGNRSIMLNNDYMLSVFNYNNTLYMCVINLETLSIEFSATPMSGWGSYSDSVSLGFISPECIALAFEDQGNGNKLTFALIKIDFKNSSISVVERLRTTRVDTVNTNTDMLTLNPEKLLFTCDDGDQVTRILNIGSNPYGTALGVANETVSEGDQVEVVMQGLMDLSSLNLDNNTTYYGTYWGGLTKYRPQNLQVKNLHAYRYEPRILEVGHQLGTNDFFVTMKRFDTEGMSCGNNQ